MGMPQPVQAGWHFSQDGILVRMALHAGWLCRQLTYSPTLRLNARAQPSTASTMRMVLTSCMLAGLTYELQLSKGRSMSAVQCRACLSAEEHARECYLWAWGHCRCGHSSELSLESLPLCIPHACWLAAGICWQALACAPLVTDFWPLLWAWGCAGL